jgi:hypothetical protein
MDRCPRNIFMPHFTVANLYNIHFLESRNWEIYVNIICNFIVRLFLASHVFLRIQILFCPFSGFGTHAAKHRTVTGDQTFLCQSQACTCVFLKQTTQN